VRLRVKTRDEALDVDTGLGRLSRAFLFPTEDDARFSTVDHLFL
jgi:hypothetical protein